MQQILDWESKYILLFRICFYKLHVKKKRKQGLYIWMYPSFPGESIRSVLLLSAFYNVWYLFVKLDLFLPSSPCPWLPPFPPLCLYSLETRMDNVQGMEGNCCLFCLPFWSFIEFQTFFFPLVLKLIVPVMKIFFLEYFWLNFRLE